MVDTLEEVRSGTTTDPEGEAHAEYDATIDPEGEACSEAYKQPRVQEDTKEGREANTTRRQQKTRARSEQVGTLANSRRLAQVRYQERPPSWGPDIVDGGNHSYGSGSRLTSGSGSDRRKCGLL